MDQQNSLHESGNERDRLERELEEKIQLASGLNILLDDMRRNRVITFIYSFSSHVCDLLISQESDARTYNATLERKDAEFNEILKVAM